MGYFARMRTTFSISTVAQAAALAALDDEAHVGKTLKNNAERPNGLLQELPNLGTRRFLPGRIFCIANWETMLPPSLNDCKPRV